MNIDFILLLHKHFFQKKGCSEEELKLLKTKLHSEEKDLLEWDILMHAIKASDRFLEFRNLSYNDFRKKIIKSESPDFIMNNEISIEITNPLSTEEGKAQKQLSNIHVKKSNNELFNSNGKVCAVLVANPLKIDDQFEIRLKAIIKKFITISKFKKTKENYLIISLKNTSILALEEHENFSVTVKNIINDMKLRDKDFTAELIEINKTFLLIKY